MIDIFRIPEGFDIGESIDIRSTLEQFYRMKEISVYKTFL